MSERPADLHRPRRHALPRGRLRQPPSRFRLFPWSGGRGARWSTAPSWLAVVVTNQAGVARGYFPESVIQEVHGAPARGARSGRRAPRRDLLLPAPPERGRAAVPRRLRLPQAAARAAAARGGGAGRRPRALLGDRRPPRRPAARLERGRAGRAGEERLRPRRARRTTRRAGRGSPTSWPSTCWRRWSASSAGGDGVSLRRAPRGDCAARAFAGRRVLVLADLVADEFLYGRVERVSREAPVLILTTTTTDVRLGGGANAVHNIRTLGGRPLPVRACSAADDARPAPARAAAREGHRRGRRPPTPTAT